MKADVYLLVVRIFEIESIYTQNLFLKTREKKKINTH